MLRRYRWSSVGSASAAAGFRGGGGDGGGPGRTLQPRSTLDAQITFNTAACTPSPLGRILSPAKSREEYPGYLGNVGGSSTLLLVSLFELLCAAASLEIIHHRCNLVPTPALCPRKSPYIQASHGSRVHGTVEPDIPHIWEDKSSPRDRHMTCISLHMPALHGPTLMKPRHHQPLP